nr:proline-rich receptor-like protein kinase PERK9 [Penaeus vannamei]
MIVFFTSQHLIVLPGHGYITYSPPWLVRTATTSHQKRKLRTSIPSRRVLFILLPSIPPSQHPPPQHPSRRVLSAPPPQHPQPPQQHPQPPVLSASSSQHPQQHPPPSIPSRRVLLPSSSPASPAAASSQHPPPQHPQRLVLSASSSPASPAASSSQHPPPQHPQPPRPLSILLPASQPLLSASPPSIPSLPQPPLQHPQPPASQRHVLSASSSQHPQPPPQHPPALPASSSPSIPCITLPASPEAILLLRTAGFYSRYPHYAPTSHLNQFDSLPNNASLTTSKKKTGIRILSSSRQKKGGELDIMQRRTRSDSPATISPQDLLKEVLASHDPDQVSAPSFDLGSLLHSTSISGVSVVL